MPQYSFKHAVWQEEGSVKDEDFLKFLPDNKKMHTWIQDSEDIAVNILHTETTIRGDEAIWGSLIYRQSQEQKNELEVFHFYLSKDILVTNELDFESDEDLEKELTLQQMEQSESTIELIMVLLGDMVSSILHKIDAFEEQLRNLLWEIQEKNNRRTLDQIELLRHQILLWKNLIMGFMEIKMAIHETFGKEVKNGLEYYRTSARIDRCVMLINSYEDEINNMMDMENVVASYRGNEIMKTLTVMTTLFTPVMAWGALWGMNFEKMPELKWTFGYLASLGVIVISTILLYSYLKKKGWTGDILQSLSKSSKKRN